jgi:hypothetical protein
MEKLKVLVLGNDPQINDIEFDRLDKNIITLGINRIWLKYIPDYFFFNDYEIAQELLLNQEELAKIKSNSFTFSSDWLVTRSKRNGKTIPNWISTYRRPNQSRFADSVTTAIELFRTNFHKNTNITFYVAGVSLRWRNPSHFWKELDYSGLNRHGEDWYAPRFEKILDNFKYLKKLKYDIISVNPDSNLNKVFRYENIENLYSKNS